MTSVRPPRPLEHIVPLNWLGCYRSTLVSHPFAGVLASSLLVQAPLANFLSIAPNEKHASRAAYRIGD